MKKTAFALFMSSLLFSEATLAASRTVQFVGTASTFMAQLDRDTNVNRAYECSVTVVNSGTSDQAISNVTFNVVSPATGKFVPAQGATPYFTVIYDPQNAPDSPTGCKGSGSTCFCKGTGSQCATEKRIKPGGVFMAVMKILPVPLTGNMVSFCSGKLTIIDAEATQPGSVVASGSISYLHEMAITGGQFQGALFMSGDPVDVNLPTVALADTSAYRIKYGPNTPASTVTFSSKPKRINQMNLYCTDACKVANPKGSDPTSGQTPPELCETLCGSQEIPAEVSGKNLSVNGVITKADASASTQSFIKYASPTWAGGMVLEMIVGPFNSICSGNKAYFDNGGYDFKHSDTIDYDKSVVTGTSLGFTAKSAYPPERLFCAHSHLQPSPFGYVGAGVPFTINGGNAF